MNAKEQWGKLQAWIRVNRKCLGWSVVIGGMLAAGIAFLCSYTSLGGALLLLTTGECRIEEWARKQYQAGEHDVAREAWLGTFWWVGVEKVQRENGGIQIVMSKLGRYEFGVFVDCEPGSPPSSGSGIGHEPLGDVTYWYSEKMRGPVQRPLPMP